jgi:hypothetical protein
MRTVYMRRAGRRSAEEAAAAPSPTSTRSDEGAILKERRIIDTIEIEIER